MKSKLFGSGLLQRIIQTSATNLLIVVCSTLTSILTARMFGVVGRGELTAIMYWSSFLVGLVSLGLPTSLIYNIKNTKQDPADFIKLCFLVQIPLSLLLGVIVWIFIPTWMAEYPDEIVNTARWYTVISIPLLLMTGVIAALAQSVHNFYVYNMLRLAVPGLNLLFLAAWWALGYLSIPFAAYSYMFINLLTVGWALYQLRQELNIRWFEKLRSPNSASKLFGYGFRVYGVELIGNVYTSFDKLIILSFLTARELGLYAVVFSLSRLFNVVQSAVTNVVFPKVTGTSREEIIRTVGAAYRLSLMAMTLAIIPAILVGRFMLGLLFGEEFLDASTTFSILCVECVLGGGSWILTSSLNAIGRPGLVMIRQLIALLVTIGMMVVLIPVFGLEGVALALLIGGIVRMVFSLVACSILFQVPMRRLLFDMEDFLNIRRMLRKKSQAS